MLSPDQDGCFGDWDVLLSQVTAPHAGVDFWSSVEMGGFQQALVRELDQPDRPAANRFGITRTEAWRARGRWARTQLRLKSFLGYPLMLRRQLRGGAPPAVAVISSNTFYAPWVGLNAAPPETKVVHWVLDLYPDVLVAGRWIRRGGWADRALLRMMRRVFDGAAANVFLGERLRAHAEQRHGPIPRAHVIEIGADTQPFRDVPPRETGPGQPLRFLYCGNLGRMHDVDTWNRALPALGGDAVAIHFRGHGSGFQTLHAGSLPPNVATGSNLAEPEWVAEMTRAEVAIVTLREGAQHLVMPSKTYSAMAAGQAILAVCPRDSDLAELILRHDAGWVIAPGRTDELTALVRHLVRAPSEVMAKRRNAWEASQRGYSQAAIAVRWNRLLDELMLESAGSRRVA